MIISCEKCNKKFELDANLIPDTGRLLQCGSCSYNWHYIPDRKIELVDEVGEINENYDQLVKKKKSTIKEKVKKIKTIENKNNKKKAGFFSYLLVAIISFVVILILIDTFKLQLLKILPNIDFYITSLYESLKDIFLFFKDLFK